MYHRKGSLLAPFFYVCDLEKNQVTMKSVEQVVGIACLQCD